MQAVEKMSRAAASQGATNFGVNAMAVICGVSVLVFICMAVSGVDMSPGLF
jgi:hypothetical protein